MATEAGKGEHHIYRIQPAGSPDPAAPVLTARQHYLGIDAVAWFINKQGNWFTDRMASGVLHVKLANGAEEYRAALGTYALAKGSRTAPVFSEPVLPDRAFAGGPISFNASLSAIKQDAVVATLLKSAARASLGILSGMVSTASAAGPSAVLTAAGADLIQGVQGVLSAKGPKQEALFDFSGLQYAMQPQEFKGDEVFLLFHRGAALDQSKLSIGKDGQVSLPFLNGTLLDDGAWLLLRLRRSDEYSGHRTWFDDARRLRGKITSLVSDVEAGAVPVEDGEKALKPSGTGDKSLFDEFSRLRAVIYADGVLTELQAGAFVADLTATLSAARKGVAAKSSTIYEEELEKARTALLVGKAPAGPAGKAILAGVEGLVTYRAAATKRPTVSAQPVLASVLSMPSTRKALGLPPERRFIPGAELAAVIGHKPVSKSGAASMVLKYAARKGLRDPQTPGMIRADEALRPVFGGKRQVRVSALRGVVSKGLKGV